MNHKLNYTAEQIKGKKISQLVEEGILPKAEIDFRYNLKASCDFIISTSKNEDIIFVLENSDAYAKNLERLTSTTLKGSEKQVKWANEIREKAARKIALELTKTLYFVKVGVSDTDYNKYAKKAIAEFVDDRAAYYIDNRFSL